MSPDTIDRSEPVDVVLSDDEHTITGLKLGDNAVDSTNYSIAAGGHSLAIKKEYLTTLSDGEKTFKAMAGDTACLTGTVTITGALAAAFNRASAADVTIAVSDATITGVKLGDDCIVYPNAVIYHGCRIGNRVTLHAGSVVGADGPLLRPDALPQLPGRGSVRRDRSAGQAGLTADMCRLLILSAGETRHIKVEVLHDLEGVEEGSLEIWARDSQDWVEMSIPVIMETTSRDFHANLVGKVCDTQGNPLKDIMVYCECTGTVAMTDENGIYGFDELPYRSTFRVTALSERYKYKDSDFIDYVIDEIRADFTLEPCANHLILDRKEVDFGSGSISMADMYNPESITINITAETDEPVYFNLQVFNTEFGTVPGLLYFPTAQYIEYYPQITFQLSRSVSDIGTFRLNALLKTDTAGSYIIPISFTNTP